MRKAEVQRISSAPERIWLQVGDDVHTAAEMLDVDWNEASWCRERIFNSDIEYIRVDRCKGAKPTE